MLPFESYFSSYYSKFRDSSQALLFLEKTKKKWKFLISQSFQKTGSFWKSSSWLFGFPFIEKFWKKLRRTIHREKKFRSTSEKSFDLHDANRRRFERRTRATGKFSHRLDCLNFLSKEKKVEAGSKLKIRIEKKRFGKFFNRQRFKCYFKLKKIKRSISAFGDSIFGVQKCFSKNSFFIRLL